jgi:hypothetical protein
VQQGYEAAYAGDRPLLDQLLEQIRSTHRQGQKLARRVAAHQTLSQGMHRGDVDRALKKLIDLGAIERMARGEYEIANPFLRLLEGQLL